MAPDTGPGREGGARRGAGDRVGEDCAHEAGVFHGGDETQPAAPARTRQHVDVERPVHQRWEDGDVAVARLRGQRDRDDHRPPLADSLGPCEHPLRRRCWSACSEDAG
jgi:hypothetical protein